MPLNFGSLANISTSDCECKKHLFFAIFALNHWWKDRALQWLMITSMRWPNICKSNLQNTVTSVHLWHRPLGGMDYRALEQHKHEIDQVPHYQTSSTQYCFVSKLCTKHPEHLCLEYLIVEHSMQLYGSTA